MIKKTITYNDYDGNERTETFWFNISKAELTEMEFSKNGGLDKLLQKIIDEQDHEKLIAFFKDLLLKSYGEKSLDGRMFIKTPEKALEFSYTIPYEELYMELTTNTQSAIDFVNGIMPKLPTDHMEAQK